MLQPLQLREVSSTYAREIPELRSFLAKAGVPVETSGALRSVALRVREDRAFHRDLALHVWVAIHTFGREISYGDLLGMLAVAAAGPDLAAAAEETDAHELLRFLMEARRSADVPSSAPAARAAQVVAAPVQQVAEHEAEPVTSRLEPVRGHQPEAVRDDFVSRRADVHAMEVDEADEQDRRRAKWIVGAGCVLAALLVLLWIYHRPAALGTNPTAGVGQPTQGGVAPSSPALPSPTNEAQPPAPNNDTASTAAGPRSAARTPATTHGSRFAALARAFSRLTSSRADAPPPAAPAAAAREPSAAAPTAANGGALTGTSTPPSTPLTGTGTSLPANSVNSPASTGPVATFGSPGGSSARVIVPPVINMRAMPRAADDMTDSRYPRLLRRHPAGPMHDYTQDELVAANTANSSAGSGNVSSSAAPRGIVRQTSLGMMAGNVIYSPTPAYPPAASAAHVQGEVKIEAEVNRDGTVGSARVVSGPPLLREAAMNAVEQWRFKPFMSAGKPVPMGATAILEFELQ